MYAANVVNLLTEFWNAEAGALRFDGERTEISDACILTRGGAVVNAQLLARWQAG